MEIKTKYNLFDEVYIMYDNKIVLTVVKGIRINIEHKPYLPNISIIITYVFSNRIFTVEYPEDKVFKTKEELINSL